MKYVIQGSYMGEIEFGKGYHISDIEVFEGTEDEVVARAKSLKEDRYYIYGVFDEDDKRIAID